MQGRLWEDTYEGVLSRVVSLAHRQGHPFQKDDIIEFARAVGQCRLALA